MPAWMIPGLTPFEPQTLYVVCDAEGFPVCGLAYKSESSAEKVALNLQSRQRSGFHVRVFKEVGGD